MNSFSEHVAYTLRRSLLSLYQKPTTRSPIHVVLRCAIGWTASRYGAITSVTFEPARHSASILFEASGLLGMPPNGSKIRRGEAPKVGVACENPLLDRKQPASILGTHTSACPSEFGCARSLASTPPRFRECHRTRLRPAFGWTCHRL